MRRQVAYGAMAAGFALLIAAPLSSSPLTLAGPDPSVKVVSSPSAVNLSATNLTDLGFGGSVASTDWLVPEVCHKSSGPDLITVQGDGGQVEEIGAPKVSFTADDAAPPDCGSSSTKALVYRLVPDDDIDESEAVTTQELGFSVSIAATNRARLVTVVLGSVEGPSGQKLPYEVAVNHSGGASWYKDFTKPGAEQLDIFVPAEQSLTVRAATEAETTADTPGIFLSGISVTEVGDSTDPAEAETPTEETTPGEESTDPADVSTDPEATAAPSDHPTDATGSRSPATTPDPLASIFATAASSPTPNMPTVADPTPAPTAAPSGPPPRPAPPARGTRGLVPYPVTVNTPVPNSPFTAPAAGTFYDLTIQKVAYENPAGLWGTNACPGTYANQWSREIPKNLLGTETNEVQRIYDCLTNNGLASIGVGSIVQSKTEVWWTYKITWPNHTYRPNQLGRDFTVTDSDLGLICSGPTASGQGMPAANVGYTCVAKQVLVAGGSTP